MNSFAVLLDSSFWAGVLLFPVVVAAILYDLRRDMSWPDGLRNLFVAAVVAAGLFVVTATVHAVDVQPPSAAECAAWSQTAWTTITYWLWLWTC